MNDIFFILHNILPVVKFKFGLVYLVHYPLSYGEFILTSKLLNTLIAKIVCYKKQFTLIFHKG
jgi:hypothetical protein